MKAITVWQPWATLIAAGVKPYEFRAWRAPKNIIGQRIAIHAGARKVRVEELEDLLTRLRGDPWSTGIKPPAHKLLEKWIADSSLLPLSSVLCTAILGEPVNAADIAHEFGGTVNDSDRGEHCNWAWPMRDVQRLEPYVPAKGAQGFWDWNGA